MSEAVVPRGTLTPNFNLNLPDIAGDWDIWGALTNDNWTFLDGALLPIWGGVMTGLLTLFGDPVAPLGAATKRYVDAVAANQNNYLPLAGGTMTGALQVPQGSAAAAAVQLGQPNTGLYAPAGGNVGLTAAGTGVFLSSSITARFLIPLQVAADPTAALGVATKQYVDAVAANQGNYLPLAGGQLTGPLITSAGTGGSLLGIGIGNNTTGLWSSGGNALILQTGGATNLFLSPTGNQMAQSLLMAPGATLTLAADATQPMQAATLRQVTAITGGPYLPLTGGQLTGSLGVGGNVILSGAPAIPSDVQAATLIAPRITVPAGATYAWNGYLGSGPAWKALAAGYAAYQYLGADGSVAITLFGNAAAGANLVPAASMIFAQTGLLQAASFKATSGRILSGNAGPANASVGCYASASYCLGIYASGSNLAFGSLDGNGVPVSQFGWFDQGSNFFANGAVYINQAITASSFYITANGSYRYINFSADGWQLQWRTADGALIFVEPGGASPWYCQGTGITVQTGNCYAAGYPGPSDARLKDDVEPWATGLAALLQLNPISWRWTGEPIPDDGRSHIGFSAQDVQPIIPDAVHEMAPLNEGDAVYLALEQAPITAAVINALKEIDARLRALEAAP